MGTIGYAILLGLGGLLGGAIWTFVIGLAGAPGALATATVMQRRNTSAIPTWGLVLTVIGQLYASLVFVAAIIKTSTSHLEGGSGVATWFAWLVTFLIACSPSTIALKDAVRETQRNVQHGAATITAPLTALGYFLLTFVPGVIQAGWGWVPHF